MRVSEGYHSPWPVPLQVHLTLSNLLQRGYLGLCGPHLAKSQRTSSSHHHKPHQPSAASKAGNHGRKHQCIANASTLPKDFPDGSRELGRHTRWGWNLWQYDWGKWLLHPKSGVWLTSEGAISPTNWALGRPQHLNQCQCCLTSSPYPAWPQRGLAPRAKWLTKEKCSPLLLPQELKPGLAGHKNILKRPRSRLSQCFASATEQRWQICHWLHSITFMQGFLCCLQSRCLCSGF